MLRPWASGQRILRPRASSCASSMSSQRVVETSMEDWPSSEPIQSKKPSTKGLSSRGCFFSRGLPIQGAYHRRRVRVGAPAVSSSPDSARRHKDPMNPSERIDELIAELTDWRRKMFASIRKTILEADREIIEEWKWMGSPVWSHDGMIAVANAHKDKLKLTFSNGASLPDPDKLFNAGLEGNKWRAIDFFEGDKINERALKNLVRAAIEYNQIKLKKKASAGTRAKANKSKK